MKIGIINFDLSVPMGDTRCTGSFASALKRLGHEVSVYTTEFNPGPFAGAWEGIRIVRIPHRKNLEAILKVSKESVVEKILRKIRALAWAHRTAKKTAALLEADFDVVDCHNWYTYKVARWYRRRNPKARIIWTMHDPPFNYRRKKNWLMDVLSLIQFKLEPLYEQFFYKHADEIIVMDERSKEIALGYGLPVRLLYLGINFPHFCRPVKRRAAGDKKVVLLGVGALSPYRRFEDIVAAVKILREKGYDARANIMCRDFWENRTYRREFEKAINDSGIAAHVAADFNGVSEEALLKVFGEADIFVFPNHIKIWGLAAFEAMAAGLPLIVSDITSIAEVLEDNVHALYVPRLRPDAIADRAMELINDPGRYAEIAAAGQSYVRDNLSWEAYARKFLEKNASDEGLTKHHVRTAE